MSVRLISTGTLVQCVGKGAWFTCYALFFTNSIGLSPAQFGFGVTIAGLLGMIVGGPVGYAADRLGAREVLIAVSAVQGVVVLCFAAVDALWMVMLLTCVMIACERSIPGIRTALVSGLTTDEQRLAGIATVNAMAQVGLVVGAVFGGIVLSVDSRAGYVALVVAYGVVNLAFAALMTRVPHVSSLRDKNVKRGVLVLRDRPFLMITFLNGVLAMNWGMLDAGVPLWITHHTGAAPWFMGVLVGFNAAVMALLMGRVSRAGSTVPRAGRLGLWAGVLLALSCGVFALSYQGEGTTVLIVLLAAAAVHVVGELLFVGAGIGLSVGLSPDDAHGEYQGMFGTGQVAAMMLAPSVMTGLLVMWGFAGWFVLAALYLAGGIGLPLAARWAQRERAGAGPGAPALTGVRGG